MQQNEIEISTNHGLTMEEIMRGCGYQNFDAMRQTWKALFGEANFPGRKDHLSRTVAIQYLTRISRPYANKPEQVIQGALKMLEAITSGKEFSSNGEGVVTHSAHEPQLRIHLPPSRKQTTKEAPKKELTYQEQYNMARDEEDRKRREKDEAEADKLKQAQEALEKRLRPWVDALTWGLNYLEMLFLVIGFWVIAGVMGLVAGVFIMVLGSIILLLVRLSGPAAGWSVFAWFVVCAIGGWLVEYPAMLDAIQQSGRIVSEDGETYAMISTEAYAMLMTILMSGSSFAGTCFRYLKSRG